MNCVERDFYCVTLRSQMLPNAGSSQTGGYNKEIDQNIFLAVICMLQGEEKIFPKTMVTELRRKN